MVSEIDLISNCCSASYNVHVDGTSHHQINPFTSVSHCSGFKVKLTFHGIQFFGSSLYSRQIWGILCLQIDLFLTVECIWYILGHV